MKNLLKKFVPTDTKILKITHTGFLICLLFALISTMILSFYHSTCLIFQYDLGITILKLSIFFFAIFAFFSLAFNKILKDIT